MKKVMILCFVLIILFCYSCQNEEILSTSQESISNDSFDQAESSDDITEDIIEKQKGLPMLLEAFAKLNDKKVRLKIVGSGSQRQMLEQLAVEKGIEKRIDFIEYTEEIQNLYKRAKATVLSSLFEGFPNVLVESIACGTPVVAYDMPSGAKDIIIEGENGYLVEYLNVDKFANAVDKALTKEWNCETIKQTVARFRQEVIMSQYMELLEKYV